MIYRGNILRKDQLIDTVGKDILAPSLMHSLTHIVTVQSCNIRNKCLLRPAPTLPYLSVLIVDIPICILVYITEWISAVSM